MIFDHVPPEMSIPCAIRIAFLGHGLPMFGTTDRAHIDAVEDHPELGGIDLHQGPIGCESRHAKSALLKPLVVQDEPAPIQKRILQRSRRRPKNTNRWSSNRSMPHCPRTMALRPSCPRRRSTGSTAR